MNASTSYRSAITGRYIKKAIAMKRPATSVKETNVKNKSKKQ